MTFLGALLAVIATDTAAALLAGGGRPRRALAAALAIGAGLWVTRMPAEATVARFFVVLFSVVPVFRTIDLLRDDTGFGPFRRLFHVFSLVDSRVLRRAKPVVRPRVVVHVLVSVAVGIAAYAVVRASADLAGWRMWAVRWAGALVFAVAFSEAVYNGLEEASRATGVQVPALHRHAIRARTVAEFWGVRWNTTVSAWLRSTAYLPLARRGAPRLGVVCAFTLSAVTHGWMMWLVIPGWLVASVTGYFVVQGLLVVAEAKLGVRAWSRPLAHAWTVTAMTVTSPLFTEPMARVLFP